MPETLPSHSAIMTGLYPAVTASRERAVLDKRHPVLAERLVRRLSDRWLRVVIRPVTTIRPQRGSTSSTTSRSRAPTNGRLLTRPGGRSPISQPPPPNRSSCGCTTSIRTHHTRRRSHSAAVTRSSHISARSRWISNWDGWFRRSSRLRPGQGRSSLSPITARGWRSRRDTAREPPTSRRCMCRRCRPQRLAGLIDAPVSTRRVFHTLLDWAGIDLTLSLRGTEQEVVLGEADEAVPRIRLAAADDGGRGPVQGHRGGTLETYDLAVVDPKESKNLGAGAIFRRARAGRLSGAFRQRRPHARQPR